MKPLNILNQLRFTRSEFKKGFSGVSEEEGSRRFMPINSIAWMVGHMAWHEQLYWLRRAQGLVPFPQLKETVGGGRPPADVSLNEIIGIWEEVTRASDEYLAKVFSEDLLKHLKVNDRELPANIGTMMSRVIYHYWYHTGEMQAVRQLLGHHGLPDFVGDEIDTLGRFYLDE